jgi:diguanylate cyclase (GGDEF)-like protein
MGAPVWKKAELVTTPSEYSANRAIEVDTRPGQPDQRAISGRIWFARILGLVLLAGALAVLAIAGGSFAVSAIVLVLFAGYVFLSERHARRLTLSMEKRLRLSLLVHNMELENMAMQDDLTQLFNRRYLFERLEREIETSRAFKRPLSLMVVDLDGMKAVNDGYGHRVGDELLAAFGKFLLSATRASDVPARTGGDEFAIILPDTSEKSAVALKDRLSRKLEDTALLDDDVIVRVTASFGVATFPSGGDTVDALMQRADIDMYADKNMRRLERDKATAKAS